MFKRRSRFSVGRSVAAGLAAAIVSGCGGGTDSPTPPRGTGWDAAAAETISFGLTDAGVPAVGVSVAGDAALVVTSTASGVRNVSALAYAANPGKWSTVVALLENRTADVIGVPALAVNAAGKAIAVWSQSAGPGQGRLQDLWANLGTAGTGNWGSPLLVETSDAGDAVDPAVAINGAGNAVAVWRHVLAGQPARDVVFANRFDAGAGRWQQPVAIDTTTDPSFQPQVAMDAAGNAMAVWIKASAAGIDLWANRGFPDGSWSGPFLVESSPLLVFLATPRVAVTPAGKGVIAWSQSFQPSSGPVRLSVHAARFDLAGGAATVGPPQVVSNPALAENSFLQQLALDPAGNAFATWVQALPGSDIQVSRMEASTGAWSNPQKVSTGTGAGLEAQVAADAGGNALLVFSELTGTRGDIRAVRYAAQADTWSAAQLIEADDTASARSPQIAIDGAGRAIAVWQHGSGPGASIRTNRFR